MIRTLSKRPINSRSNSRLSRTILVKSIQQENPEATQEILELKKKNDELHIKLVYLEERLKNESKWRDSYLGEISEATKKIKQSQFYSQSLENRLKDTHKKLEFYKKKFHETDEKLVHVLDYLKKAKILIESYEISIETIRSTKTSLLDSIKSLFNDDKVTELRLNHLDMTDQYMSPIYKIIKSYPTIETLQLEGNLITDSGAFTISEMISNISSMLKIINLDFNLITGIGAWKLASAIAVREGKSRSFNFSKIQVVNLSFNRLAGQNELYLKIWDFLDLASKDIRGLFDRKFITNAEPKIIAKTFERLAENYENLEIKDLISAVLKIKIEVTRPVEAFEISHRELESERLVSEFKSRFVDNANVSEFDLSNYTKISTKLETDLKVVDIEEVLRSGNRNYSKIVDKLVENRYDLNSIDLKLQETLLMHAARTGNLQLMQFLLKKGLNVDKKNVRFSQARGENAFLIACQSGNFECAEYLLSKGANPYSCDLKERTAVHRVVIEGNEAKLKKVIKLGLTINCFDCKQRLPLHYACKKGNLNLAIFLLDCGSKTQTVDSNGLNPLELGLKHGHTDLNHIFF